MVCFDLFLQRALGPRDVMHDRSYSNTNIFEGLFVVQKKTLFKFIEKQHAPTFIVSTADNLVLVPGVY